MPVAIGDRKVCSTCRVEKGVGDFQRNRARPDGLHSQCKACVREDNARWRAANPEKKAAQSRGCADTHYFRKRLLQQYGMTVEDYDQMLAEQGGVCAICGAPPPEGGHLSVDHCHAEGHVRGLLCRHCNTGLGHFRDNTDFLAEAIDYLGK